MEVTPLVSFILFLLISSAFCTPAVADSESPSGPSIIGIDHIPVAVGDLDRASESYRAFGFTLKPGRLHRDGIRNNHVKFEDGSGIELISPPASPVDEVTADYIGRIAEGDGPAYLSFHARDTEKLVSVLQAASIDFKQNDFIKLEDPGLNFLFFDQDNRSPTDRPEHFVHSNAAVAMTGVWLALDEPTRQSLTKLLLTLGAVANSQTVFVPAATKAVVFIVQNGRIVLLSESRQLISGRPIIGVEFEVRNFTAAAQCLGSRAMSSPAHSESSGEKRLFIPPAGGHGLWLEFHKK